MSSLPTRPRLRKPGPGPCVEGGPTCREGQLHLLLHDLQGDEVVLLVEAAVVQQQRVSLLGGEPAGRAGACHRGSGRRPRGGRGWEPGPRAGKAGPGLLLPATR